MVINHSKAKTFNRNKLLLTLFFSFLLMGSNNVHAKVNDDINTLNAGWFRWRQIDAVFSLREHGKNGSDQAIDALIEALTQHPDGAVRVAAAKALGRIGDSRAIPAFKKAIEEDTYTATHSKGHVSFTSSVKSSAKRALIAIQEKKWAAY